VRKTDKSALIIGALFAFQLYALAYTTYAGKILHAKIILCAILAEIGAGVIMGVWGKK
jgi:hypothetical protein